MEDNYLLGIVDAKQFLFRSLSWRLCSLKRLKIC